MFLKLLVAYGPYPSIFPFLIRKNCSHIPPLAVLMGYPRQTLPLWQLQKIKAIGKQFYSNSRIKYAFYFIYCLQYIICQIGRAHV